MKKTSEKILFKGRWLSIKESTFETKEGEIIGWESVVRKNNSSSVVIIAKLVPSNRYVLIKQFRPAINGYILGFPAGLGNDSDQKIIEELKEETGYTGVIKKKGPTIKPGSGIIDDSSRVIYMHIDEKDKINKNPCQKLESSEDIEVILLHEKDINEFLLTALREGVAIGANLWYCFGVSDWIRNN